MTLLAIASNNPDKIREIRQILQGLDIECHSYLDFNASLEVVENRETITGNAAKKALEIAQSCGTLTIADDTGLYIRALNDEPGVFSARFAGEKCSYADNRHKVLRLLTGVSDRYAEFRTAVALADATGVIAVREGIVRGRITPEERGLNGFGYDSIFEMGNTGKTYAEMTDSEKNACSHRALALQKMVPVIKNLLLYNR